MDSSFDPNFKSQSKLDGIQIRPARLEDMKEINDLLARVQFDVGVHILELYFQNSNSIWQVAVNENGEIVAFDSVHELPLNKIQFGFDMHVRDDYQGRGIIRAFGTVYGNAPATGNATPQAMLQIASFHKFDMKMVGFVGIPDPDLLKEKFPKFDEFAPFRVTGLKTEKDTEELLAYDRTVFDLDRIRFMRAWCTDSKPNEPYSRTLLVRRKSDDRILGFGTLRLYSDFYAISPMYADDQTIARRLLSELVRVFVHDCGKKHLYVFFDARSFLMMEFVHRLKFEQCDTEIRECSNEPLFSLKERIKFENVYAFLDYWPV